MDTGSAFAEWAIPALELPPVPVSGGGSRRFVVQPPSVDGVTKLLACAVRGEVNMGVVAGPIPPGVQAVLDTIATDEHPALGDTYQEMVDAGVHPETIDRAAYYSVFYWARSKDYADGLALLLWGRETPDQAEVEGPAPKD